MPGDAAMPNPIVVPVATRSQRKAFLEFPWQLYRDDPNWIPPLRMDQKELVGYSRHPFYLRNRIQTFLAYRDNRVCGRIAAILNREHIAFQHERRGFFGFFECENDAEAARALFDAARAWLVEQGMDSIRGPASPSFNHIMGTLVEGFDTPPTFMMAYNPPYYGDLIEGCGFRKSQDLYAYWSNAEMLPASQKKHWPIADQIRERFNIRIRPLRKSRFNQDIREFLAIYNQSLTKNWGFSPLSDEALEHMARAFRFVVVPELVVGAEIDGRLVGIALALPDYNPRIKQIDGRLFPFGFLRLLVGRRRIKKVRVMAANVLPEYQLMGVAMVLLRELVPIGLEYGIQEVEFSWVAESNSLSRGSLEKGGAKRIKTYRMYDLDL
jgi:GNAT superfamily N-acetyltransferase